MRRVVVIIAASFLVLASCSQGSNESVVTGYIEPCMGAYRAGAPRLPFAAGTVTALRGRTRLRRVAADTYKEDLPTSVAKRVHVNEDEPFRLKLAPGDYVLVGVYDGDRGETRLSLTVPAHMTLHRNLPNICK